MYTAIITLLLILILHTSSQNIQSLDDQECLFITYTTKPAPKSAFFDLTGISLDNPNILCTPNDPSIGGARCKIPKYLPGLKLTHN